MSAERRALNPPSLAKPIGFSHGFETRGGRLVFIAGQVARDGAGQVVGKGDLVAQFRQVCENIKAVLETAGGGFADVVKLTIYVLDVGEYKRQAPANGSVHRE